jgi:dihydrofolate reductase
MKAIVAVDNNWGIGNKGNLLISLPEDQKDVFKRYTIGNTVVLGRKTLDTFPESRPLKGRKNIILSRNADLVIEGALILHSTDELKEYMHRHMEEQLFVIGGEEVYRTLLPLCDEVILTRIDASFQADSFFPNIDNQPDWTETDRTDPITSIKGYHFRIFRYRNTNCR